MPFEIFTIPASDSAQGLKALNQFLSSHQVVDVDKRFHSDGASASWHFCINYVANSSSNSDSDVPTTRMGSVDYKKVLSPDDFTLFAKLREVRKAIAEQLYPIPNYHLRSGQLVNVA